MRISATYDAKRLGDERCDRLRTRLQWALGGLASQIGALSARFEEVDGEVTCALTMQLRGGQEVCLETYGENFEEVLNFIARRARDAVSRQLDLARRTRS